MNTRGQGPFVALLLCIAATRAPAQERASGPAASAPSTRAVNVTRLRDAVSRVLEQAVRDSAFPGAFAVIGNRDGVLMQQGAGHLDWSPSPVPSATTLWDLASLTKVVALTSAMMQLVDAGAIDLDAPVARYVPEFRGGDKDRVTIRHLLTHSSGLPAWRPLYKEASTPAEARALAIATPLDTVPGARMVYSDLGAIILGQVVERVTHQALDAYVARNVFGPLHMVDTRYLPPPSELPRIAPTERDPWRQRHLRGEVHDENAYALGGISSHAGLFSTGADLARLARAYLGGGTLDGVPVFTPSAIATFTKVQDPALSHRALGWETANGSNSGGHRLSPSAFGHTGFTGTSIWIDPENDVFVILLSNRVNPTREHRGITGVRVALADTVMSIVTAPSARSSK